MSKLLSFAAVFACQVLFYACSNSWSITGPNSFVSINGGQLEYRIEGEGEVLVFIGGGGAMDFRQWEYQVKELRKNYRCVLLNPRTVGQSDIPDKPFTNAVDIKQALDELGIDKATLFGLSYSGGIVLDVAVLYPELAERIIVMGPLLPGWQFSESMVAKQEIFRKASEAGADTFIQRALFDDPYFMPARKNKEGREKAKKWIRETFEGADSDTELLRPIEPRTINQLDRITAQALLLSGALDHPDVHARLDHLKTNLKASKRVNIEGAGHMVHMEKPKAVNKVVKAFLQNGFGK